MTQALKIDKNKTSLLHNVIACSGHKKVQMESRLIPKPESGEVLLKLRVVGFCGTDLFKLVSEEVSVGTVLGHEVVGEVLETGGSTSKFKIGDRVSVPHHVPCGKCVLCQRHSQTMCETFRENLLEPGGFADNILVRSRAVEEAARLIPNSISDEAAVFMEPAACVLRGVKRSKVNNSCYAVILGAGSMGILHCLVLRASYPRISIIIVDPVEKRRVRAKKMCDVLTAGSELDALNVVQNVTNKLGADAVFDTVGGSKVLNFALQLSRPGGAIILFAHADKGEKACFDINSLFKYERQIFGTYSGALIEQEEIFKLIKTGRLDPTPLVTHKLSLNEFEEGVNLVKKQEALKVLFTPSV